MKSRQSRTYLPHTKMQSNSSANITNHHGQSAQCQYYNFIASRQWKVILVCPTPFLLTVSFKTPKKFHSLVGWQEFCFVVVNCPSRWSLYLYIGSLCWSSQHHSYRETGTATYHDVFRQVRWLCREVPRKDLRNSDQGLDGSAGTQRSHHNPRKGSYWTEHSFFHI